MNIQVMFRFMRALIKHRFNEKLSREELESFQNEAFEKLRQFALSNSSFYREFYRDREKCSIGELPVLTKAHVMESFDDLITDPAVRLSEVRDHINSGSADKLYRDMYEISITSGTTGKPGIFLYNKDEWGIMLASLNRSFQWSRQKLNPFRRAKTISIASMSPWHLSSRYNDSARNPFLPVLRIPANTSLPLMIEALNRERPLFIVVYPSVGRILAHEQVSGRLRIKPHAVFSGGELLTDETRRIMQEAWDADVFNFYGATETGGIATEYFRCRNMHLFEDLLIVENLDSENRPVPDGEFGAKLAVTNLFNYSQPLIRYEMSDSVKITREPCPDCGLPYSRMTGIQGRQEDILFLSGISEERTVVHPAFFDSRMDILPVTGWQVLQEAEDSIRILLSGDQNNFDPASFAKRMQEDLRGEGVRASVTVQLVDAIPQSNSGKTPLIKAMKK